MITRTEFDGDFDLLPIRAHIEYGAVPLYPQDGDFHLAVSDVVGNPDDAAAHWRIEAVRERRLRPAAAFDAPTMKAINLRVAARLHARRLEVA